MHAALHDPAFFFSPCHWGFVRDGRGDNLPTYLADTVTAVAIAAAVVSAVSVAVTVAAAVAAVAAVAIIATATVAVPACALLVLCLLPLVFVGHSSAATLGFYHFKRLVNIKKNKTNENAI